MCCDEEKMRESNEKETKIENNRSHSKQCLIQEQVSQVKPFSVNRKNEEDGK